MATGCPSFRASQPRHARDAWRFGGGADGLCKVIRVSPKVRRSGQDRDQRWSRSGAHRPQVVTSSPRSRRLRRENRVVGFQIHPLVLPGAGLHELEIGNRVGLTWSTRMVWFHSSFERGSNKAGSRVRLVLENSTACTLSNAKLYPGIACGFTVWWGCEWCLGFFEIDGQQQSSDCFVL